MRIFTRKNALVGFVTLKALDRRRRNRRRSAMKLALLVALGLVSVGVLAGLAAVAIRRQQGQSRRLEGSAAEDAEERESEAFGGQAATTPEPIPTA